MSKTKCARVVRGGDIILIDDRQGEARPCKVVQKFKRKLKMQGTTKVLLVGVDIFTGRQHEAVHNGGSTNVVIPAIDTAHMLLLNIRDDGQLVALDSSGKTVTDLTIVSDTLRECIKDAYEEVEEVSLCVVRCMGQQAVTDYVVANRNLRAQPTD